MPDDFVNHSNFRHHVENANMLAAHLVRRSTNTRRNDVQFALYDLVDALRMIRNEMRAAGEKTGWIADALSAIDDGLPAIAKNLNRERDDERVEPIEPFDVAALVKMRGEEPGWTR